MGRGAEASSVFVATPHPSHYCLSATSYHISDHPETITPTLCSWKNLSSVNVVLDCQMGWEPLVYRGVSSLMIITYTHTHTHTHTNLQEGRFKQTYRLLQNVGGVFLYLPICMSSCVCSVMSDSLQCREL